MRNGSSETSLICSYASGFGSIRCKSRGSYQSFVDRHFFSVSKNDFSIAPMGFSPYTLDIEGETKINVWQVVTGNFEKFKEIKNRELSKSEMQACDLISLENS